MPNGARALGQEGLRLRSRRVRSDRSQRLSVRVALAMFVVTGLGGLVGATIDGDGIRLPALSLPGSTWHVPGWMPAPTGAVVVAPTVEERDYLAALKPIHVRLDQSIVRMGLLAASYGNGDVSAVALRSGLNDSLTSYRRAEEQIQTLIPPAELQSEHASYLASVRLFQQSAQEWLKIYDDGDPEHFYAAMPLTLEGMTRVRELGLQFWPE